MGFNLHGRLILYTLRMKIPTLSMVVLATLSLLNTACTTVVPLAKTTSTQSDARLLLDKAQLAHGGRDAFGKINDINVSYDGTWYYLITKIQPLITDPKFRKTAEDRVLPKAGVLAQIHRGESGEKTVIKKGGLRGEMGVWVNGKPQNSADPIAASHIVLDAYQAFLYPAFYVERARLLEVVGEAWVGDRKCDVLLTILSPGIGGALEDKAIIYIDKQDHLVRRVRLTLENTASTKGAAVDVDHSEFVTLAGIKWPTKFYESIAKPFAGLSAHDFYLTGLDVNRGLDSNDFIGGQFSEKAAKPAAPFK
jgi:hypothetical protein